MNEALTKMAVERAEIVVLIEQGAEIAKIVSNVFWRNGGVFPPFPGIWLIRHARAGTEARVPNFPDDRFVRRIVDQLHFRCVWLRLKFSH